MSGQYSTTALSLLHFQGQRIRMFVDNDGCPWWVAQDICEVLNIEQGRHAITRLDDDEKAVFELPSFERIQSQWWVNEFGLYTLILGSRKPEAKSFKRWVTHEVLPTIRRTGSYTMPTAIPRPTDSPHLGMSGQAEYSHISEHLIAAWVTLRQAAGPMSNWEIQQRTGLKIGTVRKHTRYLLRQGLVDMHETKPGHLFAIAPQAEKRNAAQWQRLEVIAEILAKHQSHWLNRLGLEELS